MIGKTISHYKIVKKLGEGGMGVVYKAHDIKLDRFVALKFLPASIAKDKEKMQRFLHEAKSASSLDHNNICSIHEINETDRGELYIVMSYYAGKTLNKRINGKPLKPEMAVDIAIQIAEGLNTAHNKGIIHRDIKPGNIIFNKDDHVKILDFGLAKIMDISITTEGTTLGTVAYMSPEQLCGKDADHRSDIWALGIVFFEMLTGNLPFKGEYQQALIYSILNTKPESLENYVPDIPPEYANIIGRALEEDPEYRYQHVDDMLTDLKRIKRDTKNLPKVPLNGNSADVLISNDKTRDSKNSKKRSTTITITHRGKFLLGIGSLLILLVIFILIFVRQKENTVAYEANDKSLAVMYFENLSGEPGLEKILVDMLTTNLARYDEIEVVSSQRLHDILKIIGKQDSRVIDRDIATQIARYPQVKTMMLGSIIKVGNRIRIPIQLCDVESGHITASEQVEGERIEEIFDMADRLTIKVGNMLGTAPGKIGPLKVADVSTSSLESYDNFLQGREYYEKMYFTEAVHYLEQAIKLDSTFAIAYKILSFTHNSLGNMKESNQALEKAMANLEKTTQKDRMMIEAAYAGYIENDIDKSITKLEEVVQKYPDEKRGHYYLAVLYHRMDEYDEAIKHLEMTIKLDPSYGFAINQLAYVYTSKGDYPQAIEYFTRYAEVAPNDANPFDSMADVYFFQGKLDEAITSYKQALKIKTDFISGKKIAYIYALKEDYREAEKWINYHIENTIEPGERSEGYLWKGCLLYWLGDFEKSLQNLDHAKNIVKPYGYENRIAMITMIEAWLYLAKGDYKKSRQYFNNYYNFREKETLAKADAELFKIFFMGKIDLAEDQIDSARIRLEQTNNILIQNQDKISSKVKYLINIFHLDLLIKEGKIEKAIQLSEKIEFSEKIPLPQHTNEMIEYNIPFIVDYTGQIYNLQGDLNRAIQEYEKLITFNPDGNNRRLIHPILHYCLAKLYDRRGFKIKARLEYQKFLGFWKNANHSLPEIIDVKSRLEALNNLSSN